MLEGTANPIWDEVVLPSFPPLDRSLDVDVAVVGGGITGITTAYLLKEAGLRVALLERRNVGGVDTSCTTAHLTVVLDEDLPALVSSFGDDHARAAWDAGFAAINQIDTLVADLGIGCEFAWVPGFKHAAFDCTGRELEHARAALEVEAALARDLGFDVTDVDRTPLVDRPGWRIENQALFHPRKYLRALLEAIPGSGCLVCEGSEVEFGDDDESIRAAGHIVRAPYVVVATHNPLVGRKSVISAGLLQTRLALYTSYVAAATLPPGDMPSACYWDTSDPYRYVRVDLGPSGLRVVAGGEDHKTGQSEDTRKHYSSLERWFHALLPAATITHRWSGQVIETADGLPLIGEVGKRQFLATGYAGNGMTFGTLAGMMARDAITGRRNPWRELFDAGRSAMTRGTWDYVRENADYAYYMIRDRFAGAEARSLRSVGRGEGRLVEVDGQIVAAHRDERGRLTTLSPVCTHLGCRVQWNTTEQTWDCPCHGSRFASTGKVLAGPAERPLEPVRVGQTRDESVGTRARTR
jgi:glycine/D-amino acid oxidase-like deaminating enzyme/nitrite reductase/ring-hydroxylating ferredoxin subunit